MECKEYTPGFFRNTKLSILILALLTFAVYANVIPGEFVWDDQTIVVRNDAIKSFGNIPYVFCNEFAEKADYNGNIYRPMQEVSYMVDYFLWALDPMGFHITSILLQIACVALLFYLILGITGSKIAAFITAALFGIHPINTEAVSYIAGRSDPLYFLFLLASFLCYIKSDGKNKFRFTTRYVFSMVFYALSLSSRETAVVFPLALVAYETLARKSRQINWYKVLPFFVIVTGYTFFRLNFIELDTEKMGFGSFNTIILTGVKTIFEYVKMLLFPFNLHMSRWMSPSSTIDQSVIRAAIVVLPLLVLSFMLRKKRSMFFWIAWFFIFLLPYLNILKLNAPYAEHWIYGAAVGIYAFFAYCLRDMMQKKGFIRGLSYACFAGAILYFSSLTITRNFDWRDEPSIYLNTLQYTNSPKVLSNLGVYYDINKKYDEAIKVYKKALDITPNETWYHNNIAIVYLKKGAIEKAVYHWEKSLSIKPSQPRIKGFLAEYKR
ncbi:MAG: tetratricopeptide repeat protein [Candidatus Omnitrophica bacterium]|nr:tetratricopeptide repeat protein [Candidatus Omnitrophota bacterium]